MSIDYAVLSDEQLDIMVAERLFGWIKVRMSAQHFDRMAGIDPAMPDCRSTTPRPTKSAQAMLDVIEAMRDRGFWVALMQSATGVWAAKFTAAGLFEHYAQAATPMLAVAIAALKALDTQADPT